MKYLVTGSSGQVGSAAQRILSKDNNEVISLSHKDLDISNRDQVFTAVMQLQPDVILNAAAMTNVDLCEDEPSQAFAINAYAVRNLASASERLDAHLVHISTDFVFDGKSQRPYSEYDPANPLSVYAKSKLGGDVEALNYDKGSVVRPAWVFGNPNGDFFSWAINGIKDGSITSIIDDMYSTPTFADDIIYAIEKIVQLRISGLINVTNTGVTNHLEMAREMMKRLQMDADIKGVSAESLNRKASRPNYSALSTDLLFRETNIELRSWQEALSEHPLVKGS